jgi:hypothetical protein
MVIWLFFKAVGKYWWTLMSCAAFTFLGIAAAYFSKSNLWIVRGSFVLAGLFLLVGCFLAWSDEHRKVNTLQEQLAQAKEDYFDARPQMGISVLSELGTKGWNESIDSNNAPVRFFIQHLSGRVPTSVRFDPVPSKNGRFSLRFEVLPHVDPPVWKAMNFEILEVGNFPQPALIEGMGWGKMMLRFVQDSPQELSQFEYPLTIRFKDRQGEERTQLFHLRFDKSKFCFLPNTI